MRNTDHTSSQDETKEKAKAEEEKEEEGEEVKADIKSNNPHLTGGEKHQNYSNGTGPTFSDSTGPKSG